MKHNIEHDLLKQQDIKMENEVMPNGESRFRIKTTDSSVISFSKSEKVSRWQNAHYHRNVKELYIVQTGKVIMAIQNKNEMKYHILQTGETFMIEPNISHNVYLFEGASTCVIKFGENIEEDWYPDNKLDHQCKNISRQVS